MMVSGYKMYTAKKSHWKIIVFEATAPARMSGGINDHFSQIRIH
jgi:hypothetical protein